jgi:hypothetical protein
MNCNVHVFHKMIFSNKFGVIPETSLFLYLDGCQAHLCGEDGGLGGQRQLPLLPPLRTDLRHGPGVKILGIELA